MQIWTLETVKFIFLKSRKIGYGCGNSDGNGNGHGNGVVVVAKGKFHSSRKCEWERLL